MEQEPINQPRPNPTRKLSAAVIGAALMAVAGLIVKNAAPEWYDPEVFAALTPVVIFGLGYYVRDRPNIVVSE
ncbi:hypothetical protein [Mesorhizobium sp. A623]